MDTACFIPLLAFDPCRIVPGSNALPNGRTNCMLADISLNSPFLEGFWRKKAQI
jgi:hypothetical protein